MEYNTADYHSQWHVERLFFLGLKNRYAQNFQELLKLLCAGAKVTLPCIVLTAHSVLVALFLPLPLGLFQCFH